MKIKLQRENQNRICKVLKYFVPIIIMRMKLELCILILELRTKKNQKKNAARRKNGRQVGKYDSVKAL